MLLPGQYDAHADQLRAAVAAERERCAKIVEEMLPAGGVFSGVIGSKDVAAKIRAEPQ